MATHSKKIIRVITLDDESDTIANKSSCDAHDDDTPTGEEIDLPLEIANLAVEKEIFLRACLQMLDKREALLRSGIRALGGSPSTDIIKSGTLKKSAPSALSHVWRVKYIELRHGQFSYCEDITTSGKAAKKKVITLNVATCICRPSRLYENCAFELSGADGGTAGNRLWLASSVEERNSWIEAILSAMVGSAGDFVSGDGATTSASERDDVSSSHKQHISVTSEGETLSGGLYSRDIEAFQLIQLRIKSAESPEAYRSSLAAYANLDLVTIPVSFVKDAVHASLFSKGAQDMGISSSRSVQSNGRTKASKSVSTQSSQAWKDLHRDVIIVNDELVSGVQGPEAMVGALVRHILQHVKMLKLALQQRNVILEQDDLNESHVLHCAREVLLACNRTQSGGDTYYCVESLLCNRDYAVLTPNASEAEPMRITISLVENKSRRRNDASVAPDESLSVNTKQQSITSDDDAPSRRVNNTAFPQSPQSEGAVMYPLSVSPSTAASGGRDCSSKSKSSPCLTPQPSTRPDHVIEEDTDSEEATHMLLRANSLFSHQSDIPGAEALHSTLYLNALKEKQAAMLDRRAKSGEHGIDEEEEADEESETTSSSDMVASRPLSLSGIPDPVMRMAVPQHRRAASNPNPLFVDISDPNLLVTHDASGNIIRDSPPPNYYELTEKNVIEGTTLQWTDEGTVAMSELTMETSGNNTHFTSFRKRAKSLLRTGPSSKPPMSPAPIASVDDDSMRSAKERRPSKFLKMGFSTPRKKDGEAHSGSTSGKSKLKIPGTGKLKKALRSAGKQLMMPKKLLIAEEEDDNGSSTAVSMCVKIQVTARSQYRLCNADPQNETDDNWAVVTGDFQQFFFLKPYCNGHPAVSDRLISMRLENVLQAEDIR